MLSLTDNHISFSDICKHCTESSAYRGRFVRTDGFYLGVYALLYMYIGYINGMFKKYFYPDDIKLPMVMIGTSDIVCNLVIYFVMFLMRSKFKFWYYLSSIIIPEFVYTMVITIFLYFILLKINQSLEAYEKKRRSTKFEL